MDTARVFRSANSFRVTLKHPTRRMLRAERGDILKIEEIRPGEVRVTNLSHQARQLARTNKP